ncbi:MAG: hypothetical protein O2894_11625, partial [Planctomycetota bacterium]|nr:hypothetical protein [Planctomycetota bacterium]
AGYERADGVGDPANDVGVTGLALLAFLGAAHTDREGPYAENVRNGLRFLKSQQDPEGCIGPRTAQQFIYGHAIGSLAVIEAYGMTHSPILKGAAQRALDFIALSRNPYMAWRYGVRPGDNDTSVTSWMVMSLRSASLINREALARGEKAPFTIDEAAFEGARAWLDKVTDPEFGRVGYISRGTGSARTQEMVDRFPAERSEAMTAAGIMTRVFLGDDPAQSEIIQKGAALCAKLPPIWNIENGSIDMLYWYYGTQAMFQVGGQHWRKWSGYLRKAVAETQRLDGTRCGSFGSWDPMDPWGDLGGRVYSTALMVLCLEIQTRHARVFGK